MTKTAEHRAAYDWFRSVAAPFRLRVVADAEGFPIAPGRYGQVEWHAEGVVAVYSQTVRMLAKLRAVPGIRRHQAADREFRLLLTVENGRENPSLGAVARLLRVRTRHALSERQKLVLLHGRRPYARQASR